MRFLLGLVLLVLAAMPAAAQIDSRPKVQARLIAESGEIAPGGTVTVALEETIRLGWHTYWVNPGEAGLPTEIKWTLPAGWRAGAIEWPYPKRLSVGPLMNYGYEGRVWLLTKLTAPRDAKPGVVTLKAAADWLVCKEVCIPEDVALTLQLAVSETPAAPYATIADQFAAARAKIPVASPWPAKFQPGATLDLLLVSPALARASLKDAAFYPRAADTITDFAPQTFALAKDGLVLQLKPAKTPRIGKVLSGVVVLTSSDGSVQAINVKAVPGVVPPVSSSANAEGMSLALAMLFALLGGIVLNLMPCVLPVLAIKALAIAQQAHGDRTEVARESFAYGAGAALSFLAFGVAIAILRAGGEAIGWGFQLQDPVVVGGFALLVFVVGLNLSGVFEVPGIGAGEALTRRGGAIGSFFTGVLAVAVAAPCTAPFMAAALGYALTQGTALSLLVFSALGIGFALPFVVIGLSPALTRWLPRPGEWMQTFRQFLAFPMYATALWLVWVLSFQGEATHMLILLALGLVLAFALWGFGSLQSGGTRSRAFGWVVLALVVAMLIWGLPQLRQTGSPAGSRGPDVSGLPSQPYSAALLERLRAQHRAVFVNATAAWCITCLVNEKAAFSGARVRDAFAARDIVYLVADWTNRNPEVAALLQAHGRSGVPLYLYYPPGASGPEMLPQVLTESEVAGALK